LIVKMQSDNGQSHTLKHTFIKVLTTLDVTGTYCFFHRNFAIAKVGHY